MANWTILKAAIAESIKNNGNQEITGQVLQNVLNSIVSSVGENATFAGAATPTTNPGSPDGPVFYIATQEGIYSNFNGVTFNNPGLFILYNTNGTWRYSQIYEHSQELGNSTRNPISQKAVTDNLLLRSIINNNLKELSLDVISGMYIARNGQITSYQNACISSPISVKKGELIIVNAPGASTESGIANMATISKTDGEGNNIIPITIKKSSGTGENYDQPYSMYYAEEDGYIRLSWLGDSTKCHAYKTDSDILNQIYKQLLLLEDDFKQKYFHVICSTLIDINDNVVSGTSVAANNGWYLRKNGDRGLNLGNGGVTPYFIVKGLKKIHYKGYISNNPVDVAVIIFYDENKNFLSSIYAINSDNSTGGEGEIVGSVSELDIDVPEEAVYARSSSKTNVDFMIYTLEPAVFIDYAFNYLNYIILDSQIGFKDKKAIPQYLSNIMALSNDLITSELIEANIIGSYINRDGDIDPISSGRISSPIQVNKGEVIIFVGRGGSSGSTPLLATVSKTNADGSIINPIIVKGNFNVHSNIYSTYYVEENGYVLLSWLSDDYHTLYRTKSDILNQIYKQLEVFKLYDNRLKIRNEYYVWFNDCICIGDSVTQGHVYDYPRTPANGKVLEEWSYPTQLAKMTKWTIKNAALSGISTINWWKNYYPNYTYTDYQIAIMELGYNGGLTDTLDTDVEPFDNYEDYAETNTGCYCKIIEAVKESNPNIFLILLIPSRWTQTTVGAIVIRKIAKKYGLPYIDLSDKTYINLDDNKYHGLASEDGGLNMVHFNAIGYLAKAQFIFCELNRIIEDNAKEVNDIHGNYA